MITEKQIEKAAYDYAYQNPLFGSKNSFAAGARWAAACLDIEIMRLRSENERMTEALLWSIADLETMHDSAGTPPGQRYLIEKLKKAME